MCNFQFNRPKQKDIIILVFISLGLSACVSNSVRTEHLAKDFNFSKTILPGLGFNHVVYANNATSNYPDIKVSKDTKSNVESKNSRHLHIYIEGDGIPWLTPDIISKDPTPYNPLALKLMHLDYRNSIYIGRPCYFGLNKEIGCTALIWTMKRYSEEVVASMAHLINLYVRQKKLNSISLIGHSGGGVLAMLLARRVESTRELITIAANLDIDMWTKKHNYTPLYGSLNPAKESALPNNIRQFHLFGNQDTNVTSDIILSGLKNQIEYQLIEQEQFDHMCCWESIWKAFMAKTALPLKGL